MPKTKPFAKLDRNDGMPVYRQIEDHLRTRILSGDLAAGVCLPNGQELSRQFGVAYRTVVRSLEGLKREGLIRGVPSRGTFVQPPLQRVVRNIAITFDQQYQQDLVRDLDQFQRGILKACHDSQFHLQLFPLRGPIFSSEDPTLLAKLIEERHIHGLITFSAIASEDVDRLVKLGVPTVTSRDMYPDTPVPWVMEDVADAARQMLRLLISGLGHRRLAFIMGARPDSASRVVRPSILLAEHLQRELLAMGLEPRPDRIVYSEFRIEKATQSLREWFQAPDRPTALISMDTAIAHHSLQMLEREFNLTSPRDFSLIAYGHSMSESLLTTVRLPIEAMTQRAVQYLEQLTRGEKPELIPLPVELIIRRTCGPAPKQE